MKNLIILAATVTLLSHGITQAMPQPVFKTACKSCLTQAQIRELKSAHKAAKKVRVSDEALKRLRLKKLLRLQPANPPSW